MTKFSDLKLDPKVLQAIAEAGYETPTPIQAGAIPHALEGRDVLGIAQTGTGKTASFTLPMITLLGRGRARARMPRSLVMCPTRELAAQVAENFDTYAKHTRLTKALLIGGVSFTEQDKLIDRGVDVLIATPGRLLDHFERGKLLLTGVQIMVVDEADRMLDMGFIPDIERIFQLTPFTRQTLFFSATMAPEIERITDTFLHSPERIEVARQATTSETITQRLVEITPTRRDQTSKQKRELLRALIDAEGEALTNAIVFCNRKTDVDIVAKSLKKHGYDAAPIHGDLDQSHRTRTLDGFRDGRLKLLIASDVAARGLDIPAVSHVFNFDLPSHAEDYVHRIGRTGRAGRLGTAISIGTPSDDKYLAAIENLVKQSLPRSSAPEGFAISEDAAGAPRTARDDRKGGRDREQERDRNRRRRGRRDDERPTEAAAPVEARAEEQGRATEIETTRPERHERQPRQERPQRHEPRRGEPREDRREFSRDDRQRGRGRDEHRGPAVMGMGDHVPQFMLVELRTTPNDLSDDVDQAPQVPQVAKPAEAEPKRAGRGRSRDRRRAETAVETAVAAATDEATPDTAIPAPEAPVSDAPVAAAPQPSQPAAEAASTADTPTADAAPEKPRRSRRKKVEATDDASADASADAAPEASPAPRKTRSRKPKSDEMAPVDPAGGDEPAKPKRSRRKKAEDVSEATAEPAPKRSRRTKAAAAADSSAVEGTASTDAQDKGSETADRADAEA